MRLNKVPIIVDRDKNLEYENHHWAVKILRVPLLLILNILPKSLAKIIFLAGGGLDSDPRTVYRFAASYKALEVLYTFPDRHIRGKIKASDFFWENFLSNARSIRNRLKLVKREVSAAIKESSQRKETVEILSLGGGSARAVIEAISMLDHKLSIRFKLIDTDRDALKYSKELIQRYNLDPKQIEWRRGYAQKLEKHCRDFHPDIVEMVGLLDYFSHKQAVDLVAKIYRVLAPGGWLITCNIRPNFESPFVTKGINWPMIYRTPQELANIIIEGGFPSEGARIVYEPFKIHGIAIAQKLSNPR